ncbi:hypothetical protein RPHASCH2410_PC00880 (plasmid) [Rhizobium phaseoli Ch24-10]|nr:hypothetical protein RPHASCH2410_PC00880 [Rhizobium phaseoli Ch24-10]
MGFLPWRMLMASHHLAGAFQRFRLGDGADKSLMQFLTIAIRNIMRVRGHLPRALGTLLNSPQFPAHPKFLSLSLAGFYNRERVLPTPFHQLE